MEEQVVIDSSNFAEYFFDVRKFPPKKGQILATFRAVAYFGEGREKSDIINLLLKDKAKEAALVMNKIHCAKEPDCYRVCREMCEDLASGMTEKEVAAKDYEYLLEVMYYTQREHVPKNDPHWTTLDVIEFDKETNTFKVKITV